MQKRVNNALLMGMIGSMLAACGGGDGSSQDSLNATQKNLTRSMKAAAPACVAWVSGGTYTAGEVVTYNGATWSSPSYVDPAVHASYGLTGVSCPLASFCAAVDWEGNALTATG